MEDTKDLRDKTFSGLIWQFCQKFFGQFLSFVVTVILARLLLPADYGVVALASMFNILIGVILDNGLNSALIQKKECDDLDYNTVFYTNFLMSFVVYAIIFFVSPYAASLYHNELICPIMRVLSLTVLIGSLTAIQSAILTKRMQFKSYFYISITGSTIAAVVGISMAYFGFGPWALVAQQLASGIVGAIIMVTIVRWIPKFQFSKERFKGLFGYAWKKQAANIVGTLCSQLKGYLIGFKYSAADLAYFNRGEGLPEMLSSNIAGTIDSVLFPALTKVQDDKAAVKRGMRRSMMTASYILTPIFFGLGAIAAKVVPILYGPNWIEAIPFMQVACITGPIIVLNRQNLQSIFAIGLSGEVLKLEFYKKPAMLLILFIAVFISPIAISIGMFIYSFYVLYMNTQPNKRHLNYSLLEQINDVKMGFINSIIMAAAVGGIGLLISNDILSICIQIPVGAVIYFGLSELLKPEAYIYVKEMLLEVFKTKFKRFA